MTKQKLIVLKYTDEYMKQMSQRVQGVRHPLDEGGETALKYLSEVERDFLNYEEGLTKEV